MPNPLFFGGGTTINPTGVPSAESLGATRIAVAGQIRPTGVPSAQSLGATRLTVLINPTGVPSAQSLGATLLKKTFTIRPTGIPSAQRLGVTHLLANVVGAFRSSSHRPTMAEFRHVGYVASGWDPVKRWNGRDPFEEAGIVGPSQELGTWVPVIASGPGITEPGVHLFRYRYLDSRTGYVSNPSEEIEVTVVAGFERLTFAVAAVGPEIVRSTDPKVDKIIVEMSVTAGSAFFKVAEFVQTSPSVVINFTDATIRQLFLPYESFGHDPPPIAKNILSHRERIWLYTQVVHSVGTANFANGSTNVPAGAIDPEWSDDALGDATATPPKQADVAWLIQKTGDTRVYEVAYFDLSGSLLVLNEPYAGVTQVGATYRIFSRANVVWVSNPGSPESFTPLLFISGPNGELAGDIVAGVGYGPSLILFTLSGMHRLSWERGPLVDPDLKPISPQYGALNQRVVIHVEGTIYSLDRSGWQAWDGVFPAHISRPIDALLPLIDFTLADRFHAVFIPQLRAIRWFVCFKGEAFPRHYVQLDVDTRTWGSGVLEVGVSESKLVPTADGLRVMLGDENGFLWLGDLGSAEGATASDSHVELVAGTTALILETAQPTDTNVSGLAGAMAYWVEGDESRRIQRTLGPTTLEVLTPFSATPAIGDTIWVGSILARLKTKAFPAQLGASKVARGRYAWFLFEPLGDVDRVASVRLYDDYKAAAKGWGAASTRAGGLPGLTFPADGTTDWTMQLGGDEEPSVRKVPAGGDFHRVQELELELREPDADFELFGLELGAEEKERLA